MLRSVLTAVLLLSSTAVFAQDDADALVDGLDQVLYCAATYTILSVHPDAPADAAADYDAASTELYEFAVAVMTEAEMDDAEMDEIANAYADEVKTSLQAGEEMRFTEEQ